MNCRPLGLILGVFCVICMTTTLWSAKWSVSLPTTMTGQPVSFSAYRGLWKQCYGTGGTGNSFQNQCNKYTQGISQLARTGLIGQRALTILGWVFCMTGLITGVMSTNAVNVATTSKAKDKAAGGAGAQFFLGGLLVLISTSWAASNIIKKNDPGYNYNPSQPIGNQGIQMTLGYAIYIGWVGAALAIAIAVLLFLGCCGSNDEEEEYDEYTPAHPMSYKSRN